jgi:hypothetical protein
MTAKKSGTVTVKTDEPKPAKVPTRAAEKFTFKSKYRDDQVALFKSGEKRIDGSIKVITEWAKFDRNTWDTRDPKAAQRMRDIIAERKRDGNPIHIFETTNMKE